MIIRSFKAIGVFGYLDFDISFNKDISFLVGGNGSGKTTALKLINALVAPNLRDLLQITFSSVNLVLDDDKKEVQISAVADGDSVVIRISTMDGELRLPSCSNTSMDYDAADKIDEQLASLSRKYADHEILKSISKIQSPIFLGLDRRQDNFFASRNEYYYQRELRLRGGVHRDSAEKRSIGGSLGVSLMETELLVQSAYGRLKEVEDRQSHKLRDSILLSTFSYSTFNIDNVKSLGGWKEKSGLLKRQKEIKEALSKIGVRDSKLSSEVDEFFDRITRLFEGMASKDSDSHMEWLLNKVQIDRMSQIVEIIDEHRSKVSAIFQPINNFLEIINDFFKDSGKLVELNTVGQIVIKRPNGTKSNIEALSSGERQLLVIFAHALFREPGSRGSVLIIDEPELSLHMLWQEKFAEKILAVTPNSQYILATHSPEIVGENKSKVVHCR